VRLWDVKTGTLLHRFLDHEEIVWAVAFAPDGRLAASAGGGADQGGVWSWGKDHDIRVWDMARRKERCRLPSNHPVFYLAFSPDGSRLLSGDITGAIRLWDVNAARELKQRTDGCTCGAVAYHPREELALYAGADHALRLWDLRTGQVLRSFPGHGRAVRAVAFSPDGRLALSGGLDRTARLWDVATGKQRYLLPHPTVVEGVAFSADGRWAVTGSGGEPNGSDPGSGTHEAGYDNVVRLWDVQTGKEAYRLEDHGGVVLSVAASADGRSVLSGSTDRTVRLWRLPEAVPAPSGREGNDAPGNPKPLDMTGLLLVLDADYRNATHVNGELFLQDVGERTYAWLKDEGEYQILRKSQKKEKSPFAGTNAYESVGYLGDFICEVQGRLTERTAGSWGLAWGIAEGSPTWEYLFVRESKGQGQALLQNSGKTVLDWIPCPSLRPITALNTIRIEVEGTRVRIFANGRHVATERTPGLRPGRILFYLKADQPPVDARFARLRLWRLGPGKIMAPEPKEKPLYEADFRTPVREFPAAGEATSGYESGTFFLKAGKGAGPPVGQCPPAGPLENVYAEVTGRVIGEGGSSWALVCGSDGRSGTWVEVRDDGHYRIRHVEGTKGRLLTASSNPLDPSIPGWTRHAALRHGEANTIGVVVRSGLFTVYFNGKWACDVLDPDYRPGFVKLGASADGDAGRAEFRSLRLWAVPPKEERRP
jgi:hypothetical protein